MKDSETDKGKVNPLNHTVSMKYKPASHKTVLFEDAVISSILSLTEMYEQSWHFIHKQQVKCYVKYLKFCSINRIIYRALAMTHLSSLALLEDLEKV